MCYSKQLVLDWATLQNLAEENFGRGRAILARVLTEKRRSVKNGRMVLLRPLAIVAMFSFAPKAAIGCRFLRMEVWIQHRQYVSLRLRSCFLFSEIAAQRPFYLLYIFSSASVGENIPKPARLHLFLGCRHRQAAGGRESFFLPPEGLFFIARHQIEPFLHIYCKIFCRIFQLFL